MNRLPDSDTPADAPTSPVDIVIDQLGKRLIPSKDVDRLDHAVQGARVPQTGRAGADAGLGRALGGKR